jgi:N-methylhydantoinase A
VARAQRALRVLARSLSTALGGERRARRRTMLRAEEAAEGVVRVVNASMERAIRRISVERGHDPRRFTLVSFGGAAGLHACALAESLRIGRVLIPHQPGLLSALGAVAAEVQRDYVQTVRLVEASPMRLLRRVLPLRRRARRDLQREADRGAAVRIAVTLDCRYQGQSYEIRVPLTRAYRAAFHRAHRRLYGYADAARAVEVVNLRVVATAPRPRVPALRVARDAFVTQTHRVRWNGRWLTARRVARRALPLHRRVAGPLVVTEFSATTLVPPGWSARVTAHDDLLLSARSGSRR